MRKLQYFYCIRTAGQSEVVCGHVSHQFINKWYLGAKPTDVLHVIVHGVAVVPDYLLCLYKIALLVGLY